MRIIAGTARGRKIKVPKSGLRPLSDQAREALFNILAKQIAGSVFLDLFAGSGAVGLEALSRGSSLSIFVERERRAVQTIEENLVDLGFDGKAEVFSVNVLRAIKIFKKNNAKFDIIFLGAPYSSPDLKEALKALGDQGSLKSGGVLIAEHRHKSVMEQEIGQLVKFREERYGDTVFSFYRGAE